MATTKDNHYVPQWYQKGFTDEHADKLCHLKRNEFPLPNGELRIHHSKKWFTPAQRFYEEHLYSTFFGNGVNDEIERKLFGPIDDNGALAIRAFLSDDPSQWHHNFESLFTYLDAQKLRTPKGLDWISSKYPGLSQEQLMIEMQSLRSIHCTLWAEGVREIVSAEESDVKFITSDHPVTIYNYACPPNSDLCNYPNDPDITLKGSQTIFPLDKNHCLILSNLEYAKSPEESNPLEQRTNATRMRRSMVNTVEFINNRSLTSSEVTKINYIIKRRSKNSIAAGKEEWLFPEKHLTCEWKDLRQVLLPDTKELYRYGGEIYAQFEDGTVHYQDAFGRTTPPNNFLNKEIEENKLGRNDLCGCGSGRKYKKCCQNVPPELRTTWAVASIRERQLAFCSCIRDVLGLDKGKTWQDVRREISENQIKKIYSFYSVLWPRETDIYSLLPKPDGKFRGLYSGPLDVRTIGVNALPVASFFDEFLIETPVTNPNNINPEFSPVEHPSRHKYQALKDFLFMLQLEPFIGLGLVNLVPDPSEFDMQLMKEMMVMADARGKVQNNLSEQDHRLHFSLSTLDLLNSTAMMPRAVRIQFLIHEFGLTELDATQAIDELEHDEENSPLVLLQQMNPRDGSQYIQFRMGPNYEMSLFTSQVTGSVLVTDSGSRWQELMSAQHREKGVASYPWREAFNGFDILPIDHELLDTYQKSQGNFFKARNHLKKSDKMILDNNTDSDQLSLLSEQASELNTLFKNNNDNLALHKFSISSPEGGFYDANVQRLLVRSACLKYDEKVRSVYGIAINT